MSSRHVRWVMSNRDRYSDQIDRDIMVAIATHIGYDDQPARLGMATIAEYAGVHYNTVDKRTKALAEAGELVVEKAGRYLTYALPDSADGETRSGDEPPPGAAPNDGHQKEIDALKEEVAALRADVKELAFIVTSLSHDVHTIVTSRSHDVHMTFTQDQRGDVNKEVKKRRREEGGYIRAREAERDFQPAPYTKDQAEREELIAALGQVVKNTYVPGFNDEPFLLASDALFKAGVTPADIQGFAGWWEENGYYAGQPALKSLIDEWGNYSAGISPRASPNGRHSQQPEPAGFAGLREFFEEIEQHG